MKFNKSILIAGAALISFASCETKVIEPSQADIDKEVAVKVMEVRNQLQADCDASIDAEAYRLADSTIIARGNKPAPVAAPAPRPAKRVTTKPKTTKPKATPPPPPPPPVKPTVGNGKPQMGGGNSKTIGNGKPKMGAGGTNKKTDVGNGKPKMGGK